MMAKKNDIQEEALNEDGIAESGEQPEAAAVPGGEEDPVAKLMQELDKTQSELEEMKNRYLRTVADLENFRKRIAREKQDIIRSAAANVVEDLLPVLDHMTIGLEAAQNHPEARDVTHGFQMVFEQLRQILQQEGLEELRPDGGTFDPNLHECVSHQTSNEFAEGTVISTVRAGYRLNDRLLRAATVIVSSGPTEPEQDASEN